MVELRRNRRYCAKPKPTVTFGGWGITAEGFAANVFRLVQTRVSRYVPMFDPPKTTIWSLKRIRNRDFILYQWNFSPAEFPTDRDSETKSESVKC